MGAVWLAEDRVLGRRVALKELRVPPTDSPQQRDQLRDRLVREARAAARLHHPGAVTVHDVVDDHGLPCVVMELLDGRTLDRVVREDGPLEPAAAAQIGVQVLDALSAAHAAGIVHRDVKPSNVVLRADGHACLTDFGLALAAGDPSVTETGMLVGSPAYIAPERARGEGSGASADLWSLGATLYAAVEGRPAFQRPDTVSTLTAIALEAPAATARAGPLAAVLERLLVRDPDARPRAPEVRRALAQVAAGGPAGTAQTTAHIPAPAASAAPASASEPGDGAGATLGSRWPLVAAAIAGLLLLGVAALVGVRALDGGVVAGGPGDGAADPAASDAPQENGSEAETTESGSSAEETEPGLDPSTDPAPTSGAAEDTGTGEDGAAPGAGGGWETYRSPEGWSVEHLAGWEMGETVVDGADVTEATATDGAGFVRVQRIPDVVDTPTEWEEFTRTFAGNLEGYDQHRITPFLTGGGLLVTDWEYSYREDGERLHALNRAVFTGAEAYAVQFVVPEDRWAETEQDRARVLDSFHLG